MIMRFLLLAGGIAFLHRIAVSTFWNMGFASGWTSQGSGTSKAFWSLASYLDFPFFIFAREYVIFDRRQFIRGKEPAELWTSDVWSAGLLGPRADLYQNLWSCFVGLIAATVIILIWKKLKKA